MADITRRFGWRHLRSAPTAHIRHHKRGQLVHDGRGLSFWYRSLSAALSEVPVDDHFVGVSAVSADGAESLVTFAGRAPRR